MALGNVGGAARTAVPPIPGVKDHLTFLEFLKNPEEREAYLEELRGLIAECDARLEKVAKVDQIDALHEDAATDRAAAAETLAAAEAKAKEMIAAAELTIKQQNAEREAVLKRRENAAEERLSEAVAEEKKATAAARKLATDRSGFERERSESLARTAERTLELEEREAAVEKDEAEIKETRAALFDKLSQIKQLAESLTTDIGD